MANHPSRGRVDFARPCEPDIHAMPEKVQTAGTYIRQEIQARWTTLKQAERKHCTDCNEIDAAERDYRNLFDAYHAWAQTAHGQFKADHELLAAVYGTAKHYLRSYTGALHSKN